MMQVFISSYDYVYTFIATIQEVLKQITAWTLNNELKLNCKNIKPSFFLTLEIKG